MSTGVRIEVCWILRLIIRSGAVSRLIEDDKALALRYWACAMLVYGTCSEINYSILENSSQSSIVLC